jgi:hypothetical protein
MSSDSIRVCVAMHCLESLTAWARMSPRGPSSFLAAILL